MWIERGQAWTVKKTIDFDSPDLTSLYPQNLLEPVFLCALCVLGGSPAFTLARLALRENTFRIFRIKNE
jgi:hypothetical protein